MFRILFAVFLLPAILALGSCGSGVSFGVGVSDGDYYNNGFGLRNGDRRGNYVYYYGDWHYKGWGTPWILLRRSK
jgi:hypothetical protein